MTFKKIIMNVGYMIKFDTTIFGRLFKNLVKSITYKYVVIEWE